MDEEINSTRDKKEYKKEYYQKNKDKINAKAKKRYIENNEKIKEYNRKYSKKRYLENKEKYKEKSRKRYHDNPEYFKNYNKNNSVKIKGYDWKTYAQKYRAKNPEKVKLAAQKSMKEYRKKHPERIKAVRYRENHITLKPKCEFCSSIDRLEGHHPDYSQPWYVLTVCKSCHSKLHYNGGK